MEKKQRRLSDSLAIIPARAGSKSIKNKNLRLFHGKPLIAWTIAQAIDSQVSRAIVTTDSNEIRDVAIKYGAEVPYLRSKELSNDTAAIEPVITDVLAYLEKSQNYIPDCVVLLMPTSPLRLVSDIDNALNIYRKSNLSSVVSVSRAVANQNPHWMLKKIKTERYRYLLEKIYLKSPLDAKICQTSIFAMILFMFLIQIICAKIQQIYMAIWWNCWSLTMEGWNWILITSQIGLLLKRFLRSQINLPESKHGSWSKK